MVWTWASTKWTPPTLKGLSFTLTLEMSTSSLTLLKDERPWTLLPLFLLWSTIMALFTSVIRRTHLWCVFVFLAHEKPFWVCPLFPPYAFSFNVFFIFTSHVPFIGLSFVWINFKSNFDVMVATSNDDYKCANK